MNDRPYIIHHSPGFLEQHHRRQNVVRNRQQRTARVTNALVGTAIFNDETVDQLNRNQYFDAGATIEIKNEPQTRQNDLNGKFFTIPGTAYKVPLISLYFANKSRDARAAEHVAQAWKSCADPNGEACPEFAPPLVSSLRENCREMEPLLANPEINPNPDFRNIEYGGIRRNGGGPVLERAIKNTEYGSVVDGVFKQMQNGWNVLSMAEQKRLSSLCCQLLDAGAIITRDIERELYVPLPRPDRQSFDELETKLKEIIFGSESILKGRKDISTLTVQDMKHLYARGKLGILVEYGVKNPKIAHKLEELRPSLPRWMRSELAPAYDVLARTHSSNRWAELVMARSSCVSPSRVGGL